MTQHHAVKPERPTPEQAADELRAALAAARADRPRQGTRTVVGVRAEALDALLTAHAHRTTRSTGSAA